MALAGNKVGCVYMFVRQGQSQAVQVPVETQCCDVCLGVCPWGTGCCVVRFRCLKISAAGSRPSSLCCATMASRLHWHSETQTNTVLYNRVLYCREGQRELYSTNSYAPGGVRVAGRSYSRGRAEACNTFVRSQQHLATVLRAAPGPEVINQCFFIGSFQCCHHCGAVSATVLSCFDCT